MILPNLCIIRTGDNNARTQRGLDRLQQVLHQQEMAEVHDVHHRLVDVGQPAQFQRVRAGVENQHVDYRHPLLQFGAEAVSLVKVSEIELHRLSPGFRVLNTDARQCGV